MVVFDNKQCHMTHKPTLIQQLTLLRNLLPSFILWHYAMILSDLCRKTGLYIMCPYSSLKDKVSGGCFGVFWRKNAVMLKYQWSTLFPKVSVKTLGLRNNKKAFRTECPSITEPTKLEGMKQICISKDYENNIRWNSEYQDRKGCRSLQADVKRHTRKCQEQYNKPWLQCDKYMHDEYTILGLLSQEQFWRQQCGKKFQTLTTSISNKNNSGEQRLQIILESECKQGVPGK